jgi:hypothetical protein
MEETEREVQGFAEQLFPWGIEVIRGRISARCDSVHEFENSSRCV